MENTENIESTESTAADTATRAGDELYVWSVYRGVAREYPAKVIEIYGNLAMVEISRPDGSSTLVETRRETPYAPIRPLFYRALPKYWQNAMSMHKIPWIGRPRPDTWCREPWR